ncbi:Undecaprenyl-phosphate 4-deoxy-4-formamido-L-arabinose transferase [Polaribacter huanghezhanensis]|uniref:glycosyltransferase family 2 protein n=1 Tax=Polaribacter huanghezhanensis TaxID=1354726 RepID=UPI002649605A|nr:glycosyltransferase [Polaribacter huanghezhanensis]WKD85941.1 Undecaprenyl-phosphate 4-deoxy-4-formamido-L-arabinose transferase [Polaribacter huanghezhanensis]
MIFISVLFYGYIICIFVFVIGFNKIAVFKSTITSEKTAFSVIIPFRNEAKNLPKLADSIQQLKYSKNLVEFLFVDDDSKDNSVEIIEKSFTNTENNISIIKNKRVSNSPKKDAIAAALKNAKNNWIITTDADCVVPKNWLKIIDNFIQQNNCNMIVAPVSYEADSTFLHQFQRLEFMSLQATTISGFGLNIPFLANGANLMYRKDIFEKLNGFEGNNSIASGDDVFLLEKFLRVYKEKVQYLKSKDVIVKTFPVNSFSELIEQRVRWASKTANYNLVIGKLIGVIILTGNAIIAFAPLLLILKIIAFKTFIFYFLLKLFFDYLLVEKMALFENKKMDFKTYLKSSFVYPYFIVWVFLKSIFSNYQWKERAFKK